MSLICPECGEGAEELAPRVDLTPQMREATPRYSHEDGTPLCPVVGDAGYEPAQAVEKEGE